MPALASHPKEALMYGKILVGYDDSEQAKDALSLGKVLADATGAELVVTGVFQFDPLWGGRDPAFQVAEAEYARAIESAAESVGAVWDAVPSSSAARGLHERAEEIGADLILVGSAHHGQLGQTLAGSVGLALLHGSPCAVGIAPNGYREHSEHGIVAVAVAFDGTGESRLALNESIELAHRTGAKLKLVTVAQPPQIIPGKGGGRTQGWHELKEAIEEEMRKRLHEAREAVPQDVDTEAILITGPPVEALVSVAAEPGTLLILGSRGYGPLLRVLLGSVSRSLMRSAPCPLIVHPRGSVHEPAPARSAEAQVAS
jgi:nucleotide-binding universal stress UspA family protein